MKLVNILFIVLLSLKTCDTLSTTKAKTQAGVSKEQQAASEGLITFEYLATTRNSYYKIRVIENLIVVSKKRGKPGAPVMLPQPEWERLLELLDGIQLKEIPKLKAPSKNYAFDGAAQTTLKVTLNEHTYQTQAFDQGNPPEAIKALVKEITDLATNME
ncbi:hypothetical protein [Pseudotamlana agarivorans]|uniref:hypothetical protein n=1 Tax=Pseudotamlana agarivorans TaxID=481183 RepID=UPI00082CA8DD|nr:hypothetical protein [Tamlana agarivorans]